MVVRETGCGVTAQLAEWGSIALATRQVMRRKWSGEPGVVVHTL